MTIYNVLDMLGGLALFLFGMHILSGALEKLAGGNLERWLEKLTNNPIKGVLLGAGVTALIQSSAATTVMMVGFVNSGIMKLSQAIGVIMGANIGTTATAWLLSLSSISGSGILNIFKPTTFTPVLAVLGVILVMFVKSDKKNTLGLVLLGFATLMFGMNAMSAAVRPLEGDPQFASIMTAFSNPILGVVVGALVTAALQSSSVSVGILQSISNATGGITYAIALPIVLGSNIGSCVTAMISSIGANKAARRVAIVHLFFNIIGTLLFLSLFYLLNVFIQFAFLDDTINSTGIAIIHTIFNLIATCVFLPFTKQIEKLACWAIKDDPNEETSAMPMLDERLLVTPAVAIEQCRHVAFKMANLTRKTIIESLGLVAKYDPKKATEIIENEGIIDIYEDKIGSYLLKVSARDLSEHDSKVATKLLHTIGDLERISDHAVNIVEAAEEMHQKKIRFSEEALAEIDVITDAVEEILNKSVDAFIASDITLAKQVEPLEDVIDDLRTELKTRHIERLREGKCTIELGFIHSDLLTNLERVSDHCSNIAVCMIQVKENNMDTHEYMTELKRAEVSDFNTALEGYRSKYALPSANN